MEGKTKFSRRLKQIDGLTWLTPTPFTTNLRHCSLHSNNGNKHGAAKQTA